MKYRGRIIEKVYFVGSDLKELKDGRLIPKKQTNKDIDYYEIYDPIYQDGGLWMTCDSIQECKDEIKAMDKLLKDKGLL